MSLDLDVRDLVIRVERLLLTERRLTAERDAALAVIARIAEPDDALVEAVARAISDADGGFDSGVYPPTPALLFVWGVHARAALAAAAAPKEAL